MKRRSRRRVSGLLVLLAVSLLVPWGIKTPRAGPGPGSGKGPLDVYIVSDDVLVPGSKGALRVVTKKPTSMVRSRAVPGARVEVLLSGRGRSTSLFAGRSDTRGSLDASFSVPAWADGSYQMAVKVRSSAGNKQLSRMVQLKRAGRVLLTTDKPIYQPRQTIHLRVLALNTHDLKPLAKQKVRLEVLDPKGNKVFKKVLLTSDYGVAASTFTLADEIGLGSYQIEAAPLNKSLASPAVKTVVVKKYVLPKFKVSVDTDRSYYLPRQTLRGTVRSDYFFGKPVAGGKVLIKASTFDVAFKTFATLKGQTGKDGSWKFSLKLPAHFVGQPLQKGDALVKLEVKVVDTANHAQQTVRSLPVAAAPVRVAAVPEGGRIVAGVANRIFVVATYPDGSPAQAAVTVKGAGLQGVTVQTDPTGMAVYTVTPTSKQMFNGGWRVLPGRPGRGRHTRALSLTFSAKDKLGNACKVSKTFYTDPVGDRVLVRTDKAIYQAGDVLKATVATTSAGGAWYVDLIKNRQTLVTRYMPLRGGQGKLELPLPPELFGTVELHAYKILASGQIMRDARVLYVHPPSQLKVQVTPDKKVYRPGERALIRFRVTDRTGEGRPSALGVIVVDEAVYALQELKPGLEKVYFTLEQELSKPMYQIKFGPAENLKSLVLRQTLQKRKQQVAQALLASARPLGNPRLWENPVARRQQKAQSDRHAIRNALYNSIWTMPVARRDNKGKWVYRNGLLAAMVSKGKLARSQAVDPLGKKYTMARAARLWPELRAQRLLPQQRLSRLWQLRSLVRSELYRRTRGMNRLGRRSLSSHLRLAFLAAVKRYPHYAKDINGRSHRWWAVRYLPGFRVADFAAQIHQSRARSIYYALNNYCYHLNRKHPRTLDRKRNVCLLPRGALGKAVKQRRLHASHTKDVYGHRFRLRKLKKAQRSYYSTRLRHYLVTSVGPDGKAHTADDRTYSYGYGNANNRYQRLARFLGVKVGRSYRGGGWGRRWGRRGGRRPRMARPVRRMRKPRAAMRNEEALDDLVDGALATGGAGPMKKAPRRDTARPQSQTAHAAAPRKRQVRVRNYFPETLLFSPALITDSQGRAQMKLKMADSITTWRMTASANSRGGGLGSVSRGIRVFQDFFVDLDLPVSLTQNDEVSVPVVVYNYLKKPQRVRLELKPQKWFSLTGSRVQELTIKPAEVAATYYRIKVTGLGRRTLQVRADGSQMSDAIRRNIEVLPDGKEHNVVHNGRLSGTVRHTVDIPQTAVPGASKVLVRLYPGVFSQVIAGMESMLRLPGG